MTEQKYHRTWEVSRMTGATHRMLQHWDEQGVLRPWHKDARRRLYSDEEVQTVRRMMKLRRAGVSLQEIRRKKLADLPWTVVRPISVPVLMGDTLYVPITKQVKL